MTGQRLEQYRKQLTSLAERVGNTAASLEKEVRVPLGGESGGGMSNAPMHLGDLGTETFSQELDATLLENETYLREEALQALDRIAAGTYGRCASCGRAIGTARLDALPYARHCVACARTEESGLAVNVNIGRPEAWLGAPGHEAGTDTPQRIIGRDLGADRADTHAAGTPGGGSAVGGLAGTNVGSGAPDGADLESAMGSGTFDDDDIEADLPAEAGHTGGAVGGTPANKRATGKASKGKSSHPSPRAKKPK